MSPSRFLSILWKILLFPVYVTGHFTGWIWSLAGYAIGALSLLLPVSSPDPVTGWVSAHFDHVRAALSGAFTAGFLSGNLPLVFVSAVPALLLSAFCFCAPVMLVLILVEVVVKMHESSAAASSVDPDLASEHPIPVCVPDPEKVMDKSWHFHRKNAEETGDPDLYDAAHCKASDEKQLLSRLRDCSDGNYLLHTMAAYYEATGQEEKFSYNMTRLAKKGNTEAMYRLIAHDLQSGEYDRARKRADSMAVHCIEGRYLLAVSELLTDAPTYGGDAISNLTLFTDRSTEPELLKGAYLTLASLLVLSGNRSTKSLEKANGYLDRAQEMGAGQDAVQDLRDTIGELEKQVKEREIKTLRRRLLTAAAVVLSVCILAAVNGRMASLTPGQAQGIGRGNLKRERLISSAPEATWRQ